MLRARILGLVGVFGCAVLSAASATAQQSQSGIAGVVRDSAGAPIAGVKVEAASAALIEKVRVATTDGQGQYKIIDLPNGAYEVTFSAAGFSTVKNTAIDLPSAFVATVNATLQRGSPEQVITVTGLSSQVDTQSVAAERVISAEQLSTLPTGQASGVQTSSTLTAGLRVTDLTDVGGAESAQGQRTNTVSYHGKTGIRVQFDGLRSQNFCAGGYPAYVVNMSMVQETSVQTGSMTAEYASTGAAVNMIPKSGSNTWRETVSGLFTNDKLVSDNLSDELKAPVSAGGRNLQSTSKPLKKFDAGFTWSGPLKKDKIWIFQSNRYYGSETQWAGVFYDLDEGSVLPADNTGLPGHHRADLSHPASRKEWTISPAATRLTIATSPRQKLNLYGDLQRACTCQAETVGGIQPEALSGYHLWPTGGFMATWSMTVTNQLLLEAGTSAFLFHFPAEINPATKLGSVSILENSTGFRYNIPTTTDANDINYTDRFGQRFSASYVTGSHAFKLGITDDYGRNWDRTHLLGGDANGATYVYNNGVPTQVVEYAQPRYVKHNGFPEIGIFAQDKWTLSRLTLSYGLRYDYFQGFSSDQHLDHGPYPYSPPAVDYPAKYDIPNWKDLSPRVGGSFDVFGDGKTALKASFAKYLPLTGSGIVSANNPLTTSVASVTRTWSDTNGNFSPDCDFANPAANGECGAISDSNFGLNNPKATVFSDDVLHGWGARARFYEWGTEIQHQLRPGMTVTAGYFHNWVKGFTVTDNTLVSPADYTPYCVTAPLDSRLPGGGGYPVCGLYDISLAKFNSVANVVKQGAPFAAGNSNVNCGYQTPGNAGGVAAIGYDVCGKNDFITFGFNARLPRGIRLGGGLDTGRSEKNTCFVVNSPQQLLYCDQVNPFSKQADIRGNASYPLPFPGQWTLSAIYQDSPGPADLATYPAPNSAIAPSLGRNLASCGTRETCTATANAPLLQPFTQFENRRHQLDLRLAKNFQLAQSMRLNASVGLYNVTNSSAIITVNTNYGNQWLQPTAILSARTLQFQGTLTF
jgi:hypothetical protein